MRVSEPVQVYFADTDRARLDHLTASLGATKSDVLRQEVFTFGHRFSPLDRPSRA